MNVRIDKASCVGCGTCVETCPEIFGMDVDLAAVKAHAAAEDLQNNCG